MEHNTGISLAKKAYRNGQIDETELELALEDRLTGSSYKHDPRIDGHLPGDIAPDQSFRYGDG
jgi:hypothetical protein